MLWAVWVRLRDGWKVDEGQEVWALGLAGGCSVDGMVAPAFASPLSHCALLSFRVSELQQLVDGHQEPYLLHWDQPHSKCHALPAVDLPWGQLHSSSSRAISRGQALDRLESVCCSRGILC